VNVFVETNFVIEVALEQEDAPACEGLLMFAAIGKLRLIVPAYSFVEPHETLTRRHTDRKALGSRVGNELTQLARSAPLAERATESKGIVRLMADSMEHELTRLRETKVRLWTVAEVLPLNREVLESAIECQKAFGLSPQDSIVYASIRLRLETDHATPSCFLSRNSKDFDDPDLRRDLAALNCTYFSSFIVARQFIEHSIAAEPT
jgi:predicted nucleic acid-binding protein